MIDLKHVLVPTDFSASAKNAVQYALAFAEKFGAEVHLLHVVQDLAIFLPDGMSMTPPVGPAVEELLTAGRTALERVAKENGLEQVKHRCEVREGAPYEAILEYAKEADVDLIIMGTHGRGGLMHMLMGSVAEKVVRKAPCPVLTVRESEHEFVHP